MFALSVSFGTWNVSVAKPPAVAVDGRGDVYLAGNYLNTFDGQPNLGNIDFYVMKFSAAGLKY